MNSPTSTQILDDCLGERVASVNIGPIETDNYLIRRHRRVACSEAELFTTACTYLNRRMGNFNIEVLFGENG